jgi:hypothetical protein
MRIHKSRSWIPVLAAQAIAALNVASAAELSGSLNVAIGHSDNLNRTDDGELDVGIASFGGTFGLVESTRRMNADVIVNADYLEYDDSTIDGEVVGGASAFLDYFLIEERFWWNLRYNYGQQIFDPLQPIRPGNRENVGFLTTGPVFALPLGARHKISLDLNYSTVRYELRQNDNDRVNGQIGLSRDVSEGSTIALIVAGERVEYDDVVINPDFERREAFIRWASLSARNNVLFDIGYSELILDGIDKESGGEVVTLEWTRTVSNSTTFTVGGGSRFSDQGDIFRFRQNTSFDIRETEDVVGTATPFRSNYFDVRYNIERDRFGIDLSGGWSDEDYEGRDEFDRELVRFSLFLSRRMTRKLRGDVGVVYAERDFQDLERVDDDTLLQAILSYEIHPAFTASLSFQNLTRSSTNALAEFEENRAFLTFRYIPKWSR